MFFAAVIRRPNRDISKMAFNDRALTHATQVHSRMVPSPSLGLFAKMGTHLKVSLGFVILPSPSALVGTFARMMMSALDVTLYLMNQPIPDFFSCKRWHGFG